MILNQLVYVVIDKKEERVLGVFNEYDEADAVAMETMNENDYEGWEVTMTPVLVDKWNDDRESRKFWLSTAEKERAEAEEMALVTEPKFEGFDRPGEMYDDSNDDGDEEFRGDNDDEEKREEFIKNIAVDVGEAIADAIADMIDIMVD